MAASAKRSVEDAIVAELALQAERQLEDSALAFHQLALQVFFAAAIGHVFAEDHDAFVALHLVAQRGIDQVGHGFGGGLLAVGGIGPNDRLRVERRRSWVDIGRIHILRHGLRRERERRQRLIHRNLQFFLNLLFPVR